MQKVNIGPPNPSYMRYRPEVEGSNNEALFKNCGGDYIHDRIIVAASKHRIGYNVPVSHGYSYFPVGAFTVCNNGSPLVPFCDL
jgi:hypothetical protein